MAKKQTDIITARVLVAVVIAGIAFQPNNVVKASTELLKNHLDNNELSDSAADVDYCTEQGEEVQDIDAILAAQNSDPEPESSTENNSE